MRINSLREVRIDRSILYILDVPDIKAPSVDCWLISFKVMFHSIFVDTTLPLSILANEPPVTINKRSGLLVYATYSL